MSGPFDPTTCPACGADIWIAEVRETSERIPLEPQPEALGEDRWTVVEDRRDLPHLVTAVTPAASVQAYRDHRVDCPDYSHGV